MRVEFLLLQRKDPNCRYAERHPCGHEEKLSSRGCHGMKARRVQRMNKRPPAKGGRPGLFNPIFIKQAYQLAILGLTDKDMAAVFGVSEVTLNAWKKVHPEFLKSMWRAKAIADAKVAVALYTRAVGHPAVKIFNNNGVPLIVPYTEIPNVRACIFWLRNRRPDLWGH